MRGMLPMMACCAVAVATEIATVNLSLTHQQQMPVPHRNKRQPRISVSCKWQPCSCKRFHCLPMNDGFQAQTCGAGFEKLLFPFSERACACGRDRTKLAREYASDTRTHAHTRTDTPTRWEMGA
eukprot:2626499-Rhodomonas_salina.6